MTFTFSSIGDVFDYADRILAAHDWTVEPSTGFYASKPSSSAARMIEQMTSGAIGFAT